MIMKFKNNRYLLRGTDSWCFEAAGSYTSRSALNKLAGMTDSDILDSRYSWMRLGATLAIAVIGNVGMWAIIVIMPAVQSEFAIARADASLPYTLTMVGFGLGNLLSVRAVEQVGDHRWRLIGSCDSLIRNGVRDLVHAIQRLGPDAWTVTHFIHRIQQQRAEFLGLADRRHFPTWFLQAARGIAGWRIAASGKLFSVGLAIWARCR